jgi:hypothetical protein
LRKELRENREIAHFDGLGQTEIRQAMPGVACNFVKKKYSANIDKFRENATPANCLDYVASQDIGEKMQYLGPRTWQTAKKPRKQNFFLYISICKCVIDRVIHAQSCRDSRRNSAHSASRTHFAAARLRA